MKEMWYYTTGDENNGLVLGSHDVCCSRGCMLLVSLLLFLFAWVGRVSTFEVTKLYCFILLCLNLLQASLQPQDIPVERNSIRQQ